MKDVNVTEIIRINPWVNQSLVVSASVFWLLTCVLAFDVRLVGVERLAEVGTDLGQTNYNRWMISSLDPSNHAFPA